MVSATQAEFQRGEGPQNPGNKAEVRATHVNMSVRMTAKPEQTLLAVQHRPTHCPPYCTQELDSACISSAVRACWGKGCSPVSCETRLVSHSQVALPRYTKPALAMTLAEERAENTTANFKELPGLRKEESCPLSEGTALPDP